MLLRFADGQGEILEALRAAVVTGDSAMAARHAHAIAGASGNLGADALRSAAKALEQAGREGRTDLTALLTVVEERAAIVLASIEALRPPASRASGSAGSPRRSCGGGAALDRLTVALDNYDVSSARGALADCDTAGLPAGASDDLERLRRSIDGVRITTRLAGLPRVSSTRVQRRRGLTSTTRRWVKELSDCRVLIVDDVKANVDILVRRSAVSTSSRLRSAASRRSTPCSGARPI